MFLRVTRRFKDGKDHFYWSLVENVRVGRRVFQRQAFYLGSTCDVVLFDLTSTYFEVDGTKAIESDLQRYGYSRDKRGEDLRRDEDAFRHRRPDR